MIKRALISVYRKDGITEFAKILSGSGIEIISTGGTYNLLKENNINVRSAEEITGFPEILNGRVKTLHPNIFAGILSDRDNPDHIREIGDRGIKEIDLVIVNLYPKKGDEVGKIRPAVIISGDDENSILDTVILLPLSTDLIDDMFPYRLRIEKRDDLKQDSDILINQIRTLSKIRIKEKIAKLSNEEYDLVIQALCKNFH